MSNDEIRRTIAGVVGIEDSAAWQIVSSDTEHNLHMINHKPEASLVEYGQIRGIVVDTNAKSIVCQTYGYTPIVSANTLRECDGVVSVTDENGKSHSIDLNTSDIKMGFEGPLINVFKHDGVVYHSTRKRLDADRSRWGGSKPFMQMFRELGGPEDDELFDPDSDYSPYVHMFIVVHPDVLVASKGDVGNGYLVYLGYKQMWSVEDDQCPYNQNVTTEDCPADGRPISGQIDSTLCLPKTVSTIEEAKQGHVYLPPSLTLEQANKHLRFGTHAPTCMKDERMESGEFVVIHTPTGLLRVESPSYAWRARMRENDPNLLHRFYQLVNGSYPRCDHADELEAFTKLYPVFTPYEMESFQENLPYVVWPQADSEEVDLSDRENRLYNIYLCFLNAVPLHRQKEVVDYLDTLYTQRGELINWLKYLDGKSLNGYSPRVNNIVTTARRFAQDKFNRGDNTGPDGRKLTLKSMTGFNIRNFVLKEEGTSLYRLIREMKEVKSLQT